MAATLQLKSITCLQQQEVFTDELYLTFNGRKISLPNMTQGRTKTLSGDYQFNGSASLSLFENDGDHWYDRDDHIGTHTITESQASGGDFPLDFDEGRGSAGAHYRLVVDVTPG
ncbi:MAG TPA: hypothetical protein VNK05_07490 [Chloroflexota bacterium]|jgi:hypothetical protein|nr:hypothetical protein [Chloroflexota bacterium]